MATGRGVTPAATGPTPGAASDAPRRPSMALQPFGWGGLQILPVGPSAAEKVAVIPPPLPGMYRTAPFRVVEYDKRCRLAVAALEAALGLGETNGSVAAAFCTSSDGMDLDLSDLNVPLPPVISRALCSPNGTHYQGHGCQRISQHPRQPAQPNGDIVPPDRTVEFTVPTSIDGVTALVPACTGEVALTLQDETSQPHPMSPRLAAQEGAAPRAEDLVAKVQRIKHGSGFGAKPNGSNVLDSARVAASDGACRLIEQQQQGLELAEVAVGVSSQDCIRPQRQDVEAQDVLGKGMEPGPTLGPSQLQHQKAAVPLSHQDPGIAGGTATPYPLSTEEVGRPAEGNQHPLRPLQPRINHSSVSQDDTGRPAAKRRRGNPRLLPAPPQEAALTMSSATATTATAADESRAVERQLPEQDAAKPASLCTRKGGGKHGKAMGQARPQEQQHHQRLGDGNAVTAINRLRVPGPLGAADEEQAVGGGGSGGGGSMKAPAGDLCEQQQGEGEGEEQDMLAWWECLSAASAQLKSLKSVLQAPHRLPPLQQVRGRKGQHDEDRQETDEGDNILLQGDGHVGEEEREVREEMERVERARQRWLEGDPDKRHGEEVVGRVRRPGCTAAFMPGTGGAYGTVAEAEGGGSATQRRQLPPAAEATLERILVAMSWPPPPPLPPPPLPRATTGLPDGQHTGGASARQQLQVRSEPEKPSLQGELVLWVVLCGPGQPQILHEEFLVLGSQYLSELRDVLGCATEDAMRKAAQVAQLPAAGNSLGGGVDDGGAADSTGRGRGRSRGRGRRSGGEAKTAATSRGGRSGRSGGRSSRGAVRGRCKADMQHPPPQDSSRPVQGTDAAGGVAAGGPSDGGFAPVVRASAIESLDEDNLVVMAAAAGCSGSQIPGDAATVSADPSPPPPSIDLLLPPSYGSYLFVEGHFYADVRHPEAEDYTAPIRELCSAHGVRPTYLRPERGWRPAFARHHGGQLPGPIAMHTTRFVDLTVRQANQPIGLFCHRACCEHLMFIRDVRSWSQGDAACRSAYPVRLRTRDHAGAPVARRRCSLCEARYAELVTHDDPLAPSNPAVMCRHCFDLLHIGSNGERLAPYVVVQPYNPALDIATQGIWAPPAGPSGVIAAAAGGSGGGRGRFLAGSTLLGVFERPGSGGKELRPGHEDGGTSRR